MLAASRRATELIECHEDEDDDDDEYVSAGESPSARGEAPTGAHPQLITDVEHGPQLAAAVAAARGLKLRGNPRPHRRAPVPPPRDHC